MRKAVLYDEAGKEIFRGHPADLPVRFVSQDGQRWIDWTMREVVETGAPPEDDESTAPMLLHPEG